jgi:hypothetical protein
VGLENKSLNHVENLTLINAAVSERTGEISFLDCINGRISSSGSAVKCFTIDALTETYGQPDLVFVDIEGYEWLALQSSRSTLGGSADWFVEVHAGCGLESFGGSAEDIVGLFRSFGYFLYCQSDVHYRYPFQPLTSIPKERFFLIATRQPHTPDNN